MPLEQAFWRLFRWKAEIMQKDGLKIESVKNSDTEQGRGSRFKVQGERYEVQGAWFKVRGSMEAVRGGRFEVQYR